MKDNKSNTQSLPKLLYLLFGVPIILMVGVLFSLFQLDKQVKTIDESMELSNNNDYFQKNNGICESNYIVKFANGTIWRNCEINGVSFNYPESFKIRVNEYPSEEYLSKYPNSEITDITIGIAGLYFKEGKKYINENPPHVDTNENPINQKYIHVNGKTYQFKIMKWGEGFAPEDGCGDSSESWLYIADINETLSVTLSYHESTSGCGSIENYKKDYIITEEEINMAKEILLSIKY